MDTSQIYIKMCEKAKEIQDMPHPKWSFLWGPDVWDEENPHIEIVHWSGLKTDRMYRGTQCIWLPRQDQLQEMIWMPVMSNYKCAKDLFVDFTMWIQQVLGSHNYRIDKYQMSAEQLWLAFVMFERFSKFWNGEDWVLEENVK